MSIESLRQEVEMVYGDYRRAQSNFRNLEMSSERGLKRKEKACDRIDRKVVSYVSGVLGEILAHPKYDRITSWYLKANRDNGRFWNVCVHITEIDGEPLTIEKLEDQEDGPRLMALNAELSDEVRRASKPFKATSIYHTNRE
ncbi:hypothetical protein KY328_05020 [Candidatus Woesearchaeota archaeon]|nr:hypothetical protein [Candidatus Woesearchaeota archaeon]MBW3022260.1 hypothetical protein [Candidatus Woesearchaeota archaeon]